MIYLRPRSFTLSLSKGRKMLEMGIIENSFFYCLNQFNYLIFFETGRKNPTKDYNASFLIEVESRELATMPKKQIPP